MLAGLKTICNNSFLTYRHLEVIMQDYIAISNTKYQGLNVRNAIHLYEA